MPGRERAEDRIFLQWIEDARFAGDQGQIYERHQSPVKAGIEVAPGGIAPNRQAMGQGPIPDVESDIFRRKVFKEPTLERNGELLERLLLPDGLDSL